MKKPITYFLYFIEYLKHGDFTSLLAAAKYLIQKKSHSRDRIIQSSIGKFFCRKNTNDFQFANYYYEWGVKKYILDHKNEYTTFIDGGACVGDYCILLSKFNMQCIAFEPVLNNFEVLEKNLELNNLTAKVKAFPIGLGARNAKNRFVFNPVNTGASHSADIAETEDFLVEIRTFDSFLEELNLGKEQNILFKLDIEGMEAEAIQGAEYFIRDYPNITFIIEDKHTGKDSIEEILCKFATFEFGLVDEFNIYAKKVI